MPRNISFSLTTKQFRDRTKTVTRRLGWQKLKPGDLLNACVKCMGLKAGEKVERLGQIRVKSAHRMKLRDCTDADAVLEGFPDMTGNQFVKFYCQANRCKPTTTVTRIEFEYMD